MVFFESINIKFLPINIYLKLKDQLITILTKNCFNKSKKLVLKIKQLYLSIINLRLIIDKYSISNSDTLKKLKKNFTLNNPKFTILQLSILLFHNFNPNYSRKEKINLY